MESPTNPLLKLVDLQAIGEFAKKHNLIAVCDNTFCSPYVQKPLDFGFDIVVHSATKYLNGHSDVIGGIAVCAQGRDDLVERMFYLSNAIGSIMSPFDSFFGVAEPKDSCCAHGATLQKCYANSDLFGKSFSG